MRVVFESWFCRYKVDIVFAGHVHAYERSVCPYPSVIFPLILYRSMERLNFCKKSLVLGATLSAEADSILVEVACIQAF